MSESISLKSLELDLGEYRSFVNPNAVCPVCGASVYFYQSSNGGRVFFDELGPPWPKHPCTDNGSIRKVKSVQASSGETDWMRKGWTPFYLFKPKTKKGFYLIRGYLLTENEKIELTDCAVEKDSNFVKSDFRFYREINNNTFEIIFFNSRINRIGRIIGHKNYSAKNRTV